MLIQKPQKLSSLLPATPCTPEMREVLETIAKKEGVSMAYIQRIAVENFLDTVTRNTGKNTTNTNKCIEKAS